jgi:hypothetical protein
LCHKLVIRQEQVVDIRAGDCLDELLLAENPLEMLENFLVSPNSIGLVRRVNPDMGEEHLDGVRYRRRGTCIGLRDLLAPGDEFSQ